MKLQSASSLATFFLLTFIVMQGLTAWHAADYGSGKHEHNGALCEFYVSAEKIHFADIGSIIALGLVSVSFSKIKLPTIFNAALLKRYKSPPRAPPFFS